MTQKSHTKDEKFMLKAYEMAMLRGDKANPVDRYEVGRAIGMQPKGVDTTCVLLAQANFIKKLGPVEIRVTEQGERLVNQLKGVGSAP